MVTDERALLAGERQTPEPRPDDVVLNPVRLAVFRMVVERRGFTRAAEALSLTQSTVSDHIRLLEAAIGSPVFDRTRRGGQLTEVGQAVYDFALTLQQELTALQARVSDLTAGRGGLVTLGATMIPGTRVLPGLLAGFHDLHPAGQIAMRLLSPDAICADVSGGKLDLGVVSEAEPLSPELEAGSIWCDTDLLVAPPEHPLAGRESVTLADVAGESFVVAWGRTLGDQTLDRALAGAGLPARRVVMAVGSQDGVREAVLRGVGLAVVFRRVVAEDLAAGRLAALPLTELAISERHLLVHRRAHRLTPIVSELIAYLRREAPMLSD